MVQLTLARRKTRAKSGEVRGLGPRDPQAHRALKRQTPLVAELQIALRQIAQAASIISTDPGPAAVADVPSVNEPAKVLAAP